MSSDPLIMEEKASEKMGRVVETAYSASVEVKADAALLELLGVEATVGACSDSKILLQEAAKMMKVLPSLVEETEMLPFSFIHQH